MGLFKVYILQDGEGADFADDSGKQTLRYFCIISDDDEPVCLLRE